MATPVGIHPARVAKESSNNSNNVKLTTVTPGTGRIHVTETITLTKITTLGSNGSITIVDGVVTAATAAS